MESNGTLIKQYFDCFINQLCFKMCINCVAILLLKYEGKTQTDF